MNPPCTPSSIRRSINSLANTTSPRSCTPGCPPNTTLRSGPSAYAPASRSLPRWMAASQGLPTCSLRATSTSFSWQGLRWARRGSGAAGADPPTGGVGGHSPGVGPCEPHAEPFFSRAALRSKRASRLRYMAWSWRMHAWTSRSLVDSCLRRRCKRWRPIWLAFLMHAIAHGLRALKTAMRRPYCVRHLPIFPVRPAPAGR